MSQANKNKKETKNNKIKKEEENIQKESKSNEKNVPIGLPTKTRIKCEVCSKEDAEFYCSQCLVHYCLKCEDLVHSHFLKKKHQKFISQDIFIKNQESKETNNNRCPKHKKKFKIYCEEEDQLICRSCIEYCLDQNHSLLTLNSKSNQIFQKMQIILKEIQTKEKENQLSIQKSQQNKNKLKQKIQQISQQIEKESDLLKQQIDKSKNQQLKVLKTIQIIIENQFNQKIQNNEKTIQKINEDKTKIQKISNLKTKNKNIELINESKELINEFKEIINKFKKRKEKEKEIQKFKLSKEIFDPKMNSQNTIKLKNQNQTAWNPSTNYMGRILGQTKYSTGKHKIQIKIDQFPNTQSRSNRINLGVIQTENREKLIRNRDYEESYYFATHWNKNLLESSKRKKENGKQYEERYPENIKLKENDILEILLDMDQKTIAFKINENYLGIAWENLPKSVHFFAYFPWMKGNKKNQITLI
ncbi:tripartite motif-containing protein [Anaeramoeba flamelloides]|uniref:Tripartite motif-containing protein n=1 Tax=Anaeramoeba flamelloides TaxID=1746091 RepID=A0AAV7YP82_9EUKA|nr:tripartite motif-containing protein [Anaeramoeba flamelloides]